MTCSILDQDTKEPLKAYRADNGQIYHTLTETLQNSSNSYEIGFRSEVTDFDTKVTIPIYPETTTKGKIQKFIKNEFLKPTQEEGKYLSEDSYALGLIKDDLALAQIPYYSQGDYIEIYDNLDKSSYQKVLEQVKDKDTADLIWKDELIVRKLTQPNQTKSINYSKEELELMINNLLVKMGVSKTSLEAYKTKHEVEPNAEALIDLTNRVIAIATGKETLENLSEEACHLIIESYDQAEINRLTQLVPQTSYYLQYAEQYRAIYSKQSSDPKIVEEYVRREVLGKMLAESLQKGFTTENSTDLEKNFFQKLLDILKKFLGVIKVTPQIQSDIDLFTEEIKKHLYNDTLAQQLDQNFKSQVEIMYKVEDMNSATQQLIDEIKSTIKVLGNKKVSSNEQTENIQDQEILNASALEEGIRLFEAAYQVATKMTQALKNKESLSLLTIDPLINSEDDLGFLATKLEPLFTTQQTKQSFHQQKEETLIAISLLKQARKETIPKTEIEIVDEFIESTGMTESEGERIKDSIFLDIQQGIQRIAKDCNVVFKKFGNLGKTSNTWVNMIAKLMADLNINAYNFSNHTIDKYIKITENIPLINKLFVKDANIISQWDEAERTKAKRSYEYKIRKEVNDTSINEVSLEDFLKDYDEKYLPKNISRNIMYEYDYTYKKGLDKEDWVTTQEKKYAKEFIEKIDSVLKSANKPFNNPLYKYLLDDSNRRFLNPVGSLMYKAEAQQSKMEKSKKARFYNSDGNLLDGIILKRFSDITSQDEYYTKMKEPKANDYVYVLLETSSDSAKLAFYLNKWNQVLNESSSDFETNFKEAFNKQVKIVESMGLSQQETNIELKKWLDTNSQFNFTDEYWNNFEVSSLINYDAFYKKVPPRSRINGVKTVANVMDDLRLEVENLKNRRSELLKTYKTAGDTREIDVVSITELDRNTLESLEVQISQKDLEIQNLFKTNDVKDIYLDVTQKSIPMFNKGFYEYFENKNKKPYSLATSQEKEIFWQDNFTTKEKYGQFLAFKKILNDKDNIKPGHVKYDILKRYQDLIPNNQDKNDIDNLKDAFYRLNASKIFKRYDIDENYQEFLKDYKNGVIDLKKMINQNYPNIIYNGKSLNLMKIQPAFKYNSPHRDKIDEKYKTYKDREKATDLEKLTMLEDMQGVEGISEKYRNKEFNNIKNNPEHLSLYIQVMELQLENLERLNSLNTYSMYKRPAKRKEKIERYENIITKGDKKAQLKDWIKEGVQFREDDYQNSKSIPNPAHFKVDLNEMTEDLGGSLIWMTYQSHLYDQRIKSLKMAGDIKEALMRQTFKDRDTIIKPTDTNYFKMIQEAIDFNIYGKTVPFRHRVTIPIINKEVDLGKILLGFKGYVITTQLGMSPVVAGTNLTSGMVVNLIKRLIGKDIYGQADNRANLTLAPMWIGSVKDIGSFMPTSKINNMMYSFGIYNKEERFQNAKYSKVVRLLPEISFAFMATTNFMLQSKILLTKLMEIRLIDGKFQDWNNYLLDQKTRYPEKSKKEIKAEFDTASQKSMYDYIQQNGEYDLEKLKQDGYNGDINKDKTRAISKIQNMSEIVTSELKTYSQAEGARDPLWSFVLSLKKYLILANTALLSKERFDINTGGMEVGMIYAYKDLISMFKAIKEDKKSMREAYDSLEYYQQKNLKTIAVTGGVTALLALTVIVLAGYADDDDEKDNYTLQLANFLALRTLNETFSSNIGIGNSIYESLQNPVSSLQMIPQIAGVLKFGDIGTPSSAQSIYAGDDEYLINLMKLTSLKNLYGLHDTETLIKKKDSYKHFATDKALYHIFSRMDDFKDSEDNK